MTIPALLALALATATIGTLGGFGGAVLLVPTLVLLGVDPVLAAPLGLISVAAGSLSAAPKQLASGLVHHRLGITLELTATSAAVIAAWVSGAVSGTALQGVLAATAFVAGLAGFLRPASGYGPVAALAGEPSAEWPGSLDGAIATAEGVVPYRARNMGTGLVVMTFAGVVTGLSGVGAGFIKTPTMRELMYIPLKVAAATSTFSVAITSSTALLVFALQGRIDPLESSAVALGGLIGGVLGSAVQDALPPVILRRFLSVMLIVIATVLVVQL
ncbi:MAG: sulfite exporter TauE/SafE family protein [Acidimicrobiia bacterium]